MNSNFPPHEVLFQYALNIKTAEKVTPTAAGTISGEKRFYNPILDKGNLVCPECSEAHLIHRSVKGASGDHFVRDHFATRPDSKHSAKCDIGARAAKMKDRERSINPELGPFFYLNLGTPKKDYPHGGRPTKRAWISHPNEAPDWVFKVQYARNTFLGNKEIISPELVRRERINPVKDVIAFLKNLTRIHKVETHRQDSWAVINGVAIRLDKMVLREQASSIRDMDEMSIEQFKTENGISASFKIASDKKYDRFARQLNLEQSGILHPVLLHFKIAATPQSGGAFFEQKMTVNLGDYDLEGQKVGRYVHIKDRALFSNLEIGSEFFAIAHPYMSKVNGRVSQNFNVLRSVDMTSMTLQEFRLFLENPKQRTKLRAPATTSEPVQMAIPS